jgi:hypothetical protein
LDVSQEHLSVSISLIRQSDQEGRSWKANELSASSEKKPRVFRVELWNDEIHVIGRLEGAFAQYRTLDPFVSRLLQEGREGEAVLIDDVTGEIIAKRKVVRTYFAQSQGR